MEHQYVPPWRQVKTPYINDVQLINIHTSQVFLRHTKSFQ